MILCLYDLYLTGLYSQSLYYQKSVNVVMMIDRRGSQKCIRVQDTQQRSFDTFKKLFIRKCYSYLIHYINRSTKILLRVGGNFFISHKTDAVNLDDRTVNRQNVFWQTDFGQNVIWKKAIRQYVIWKNPKYKQKLLYRVLILMTSFRF